MGVNLLRMLTRIGQGAADTALEYHMRSPSTRRKARRQADQQADDCTPCAAGAYVDQLRSWAKGYSGR